MVLNSLLQRALTTVQGGESECRKNFQKSGLKCQKITSTVWEGFVQALRKQSGRMWCHWAEQSATSRKAAIVFLKHPNEMERKRKQRGGL